jgi:hypothetical protein
VVRGGSTSRESVSGARSQSSFYVRPSRAISGHSLHTRCEEFIESPLKAIHFRLCASVVRIETQRLTGLFERQFPVPFNREAVVNLPGVLGKLNVRQTQCKMCGRLIGMCRDETARQRVHAVNSIAGHFGACLFAVAPQPSLQARAELEARFPISRLFLFYQRQQSTPATRRLDEPRRP